MHRPDGPRRWRRTVAALLASTVVAGACGFRPDDPRVATPPTSTTTATAGQPRGDAPPSTSTTAGPPAAPARPATTLASGVACPAVPPRTPPRADRSRYVLRVDVRPAEGVVTGEVTVRFTPDLPTDEVVFRLWPNGPRSSQAGARLQAGPIALGAHQLPTSTPDPTTLRGAVGRTLRPGETIELTVPYTLTLPGPVNDRVSRSGEAIRLGSFYPLLAWEPGVGWGREPPTSAFAEASVAAPADYTVSVDVPDGLGVLASGIPDGPGRFTARAAGEFAMSVGRFTTATRTAAAPDPVAVTVGVHAGIGESPESYLDKVVRSLEDFAQRYGPYPWPTYTLAITPELKGGIEYPMHVMQGPGTGGRTTSHEVAHMWFFGLVAGNQGRDPVLDEGLASFAEARFEGTLAEMVAKPIPADGRGRAGEPMTFWESRQPSYYRSVYVQGAQALAALGPADAVDCALRHFVAAEAHRVATQADLVAAAERVFGPGAAATLGRFGIRTG